MHITIDSRPVCVITIDSRPICIITIDSRPICIITIDSRPVCIITIDIMTSYLPISALGSGKPGSSPLPDQRYNITCTIPQNIVL